MRQDCNLFTLYIEDMVVKFGGRRNMYMGMNINCIRFSNDTVVRTIKHNKDYTEPCKRHQGLWDKSKCGENERYEN